jgi:hypothetical protein
MWDVNGDGQLSPNDALVVVNYLNRSQTGASGEGEASSREATSATPQLLSYPLHDPTVRHDDIRAFGTLIDEVMSVADNIANGINAVVPVPTRSDPINEAHDWVWERLGESVEDDDLFNSVTTSLEKGIDL